MKNIALISYKIMFDPSESWSNGYQFEAQFADFFAAHGFEAQIITPAGGTGDRVIYLERVYLPEPAKRTEQPKQDATTVIKQIQTVKPSSSFKEYQSRGVPKAIVNQEKRSPKPTFHVGRSNRMKVRQP